MADRFAAFAPQLIRDNASRRVGDVVKCVHLTSDAGMALNGAVGRVVGVGSLDDATVAAEGGAPFRVKVEFDGIPEIKSIRTVNLVHPNHRQGPGGGETASHTTTFAWCTPFLKDFSRRHSSPALPFQRTFDR